MYYLTSNDPLWDIRSLFTLIYLLLKALGSWNQTLKLYSSVSAS